MATTPKLVVYKVSLSLVIMEPVCPLVGLTIMCKVVICGDPLPTLLQCCVYLHLCLHAAVFEIKLGTVDQSDVDVEWRLRPYMNTAKKRLALSTDSAL